MVDVTLLTETGVPVDMGTRSIFGDEGPTWARTRAGGLEGVFRPVRRTASYSVMREGAGALTAVSGGVLRGTDGDVQVRPGISY